MTKGNLTLDFCHLTLDFCHLTLDIYKKSCR